MTAKPKRDSSGRFLPKWAGELQRKVFQHDLRIEPLGLQMRVLQHRIFGDGEDVGLQQTVEDQSKAISDISSRLGTSTPLIIWNIAVLIAIAGIAAKVWGYAPY